MGTGGETCKEATLLPLPLPMLLLLLPPLVLPPPPPPPLLLLASVCHVCYSTPPPPRPQSIWFRRKSVAQEAVPATYAWLR